MIQGGVDLVVRGVNRVGASRRWVGARLTNQADQWPEQTQPELDQQHPQFEPDRRQAVAPAVADTLDEATAAFKRSYEAMRAKAGLRNCNGER